MEFEGRTEKEAVEKACAALKVSQEDLDYTVVDEGSGGVFGIGARPTQIRVRVPEGAEVSEDQPEEKAEPAAEAEAVDSVDDIRGGVTGPSPEKAAMALEVAQGLAEKMGLEKATITVRDDDAQIVILIEEGEDSTDVAEILGKSRPPAIPSFQFLLNKIVNRFPDDRKHIIVEVPSVPRRERRAETPKAPKADKPAPELDPDLDPALVELARSLAEKSQSLNKVLTIHPMLPADRRALHQTITAIDGVSTVSEGEGLYRRLHVVPDSMKAGGKKRRRRRRRRRKGEGEGESAPAEAAEVDAPEAPESTGDDGDAAELQDAPA